MPFLLRLPRTYRADRTVLAALVLATAWLSLTLARGPGELSAIWVGNGLLTGWLLCRRTRTWPGYVAVAVAADVGARLLAGDAAGYAMAIAACNAAEALLVAGIVRRRVPDIRAPRDWVALGGLATAATLLACALSGAVAAGVAQALHGRAFLPAFAGWYAAHVVGMVLVATTTLVAQRQGLGLFRADGRGWSLAATMAVLVAVAVAVFLTPAPLLFLTYPPLLLVAQRHDFAGVVLGVIALGLVAAIATTLGHGPLWHQASLDGAGRIALLQVYLAGGCLMTIPVCLANAERKRLSARLAESLGELERLTRTDPLTGLANRRQFDERFALALALARLRRGGPPVALLCLDIDHFKQVNDSLGHAAGDAVLLAFGRRLCDSVRATDLVARLGGDEFVLLLEDATPAAAETVARKVLEAARAPIGTGGAPLVVGTSIGIACARRPTDATTLMARADAALYAAKQAGRNRYEIAPQPADDL